MPNRLQHETSPYLQQHADNPVDWWPWGEDALELARRENKPILLSIGYSACHWCHVMAHESFEDPEVAAQMNRLFINIKVDREERPDLDQIYQAAHHMLAKRNGGWPLTVFLTPDGSPFFSGTYFPKTPRYNLPGFPDLLARIDHAFRDQRSAIEEQNQALRAALAQGEAKGHAHPSDFTAAPLQSLRDGLASTFDEEHGGFGSAPKFPHPADLDFLLRHSAATGDEFARDMALKTLRGMAEGGIFDQLGGGFSRYSVDGWWNIPHFEKMLYDNGPLLALYADAWTLTGDPLFFRVAAQTVEWLLREMRLPDGGFASSLDADSEHEEGKFYVWDKAEVRELLDDLEFRILSQHYGVARPPNFEEKHWHFHIAKPLAGVAAKLGIAETEAEAVLASARAKLFARRETRVHPARDDKLLVSWNGLMIHGLIHAARVFDRPDWLAAATAAIDFIRTTLWRDGRLLATCKDGRAHLNAYLDDHALLIAALLESLQAGYRAEDLEFAEDLADALLDDFQDESGGGFFFTRHDHETLIHRPKTGLDNAMPAGNGIAAQVLGRLGHLTGEARYLAAAERTLQAFYPAMRASPMGFASLGVALAEHRTPPSVLVLRGSVEALPEWQRQVLGAYRPGLLSLGLPPGLRGLPPVLDKPAGDAVNAWLCSGVNCLRPFATWPALAAELMIIGKPPVEV
ncbi:thioredoxin domain-containing protein [Zoogloea sp.]|uniref:thioredoxin domain-containing protein n=1 Tax=Zoogloea sp. TaxID=49181 RepID=UPI00258EBD7B|nr:thioredoxin domain-containing protein [Zoogloea sp.]MDD2669595.1 thioredoxin domain-containing protein [Zoogloea sp.]